MIKIFKKKTLGMIVNAAIGIAAIGLIVPLFMLPDANNEIANEPILNSKNKEKENPKIEDEKEIFEIERTKSKTILTVKEKINSCNMESERSMYREQRILIPESIVSNNEISLLNIYYGNDNNVLNMKFKTVKEFRDYAKLNLNLRVGNILENSYIKLRDSIENTKITFLPKAKYNSNDIYIDLNSNDMPGMKWPSVIILEIKDKNNLKYLATEVADISGIKNAPTVMPFSVKLKNGKIVTHGVNDIKSTYSVYYNTMYENRKPETNISKYHYNGKIEDVKFEVPYAEQLSKIEIYYDVNPGNYDIELDSQYNLTLFDLDDIFFENCDPAIKNFKRTKLTYGE